MWILSPVAKMTYVRIMVPFATTYLWPLHQLDIKNTFLNAILDKEFYMEYHQALLLRGRVKVCRLEKSLYGLKQSLRAWFRRLASVIQEFGLCRVKKTTQRFDEYNIERGSCY